MLDLTESVIQKTTALFNASDEVYERMQDNYEFKEFLLNSIEFLTVACGSKYLFTIFAKQRKEIVVNLVLNMVRMNQSECEVMQDDPHEFVNNLFASFPKRKKKERKELKSEHEYSNLRLLGFRLVQSLCENIDGLITFVAVLSSELVE